MPRPRSLTPSGIAAAALAVIDREGLAALSMRAVAGELGVGTMSLYRYVEGRDELEELVVDSILSTIEPEVPARAAWSTRVTTLLERVREAMGDHPAAAPLLLTRRHTAEGALRWGEALLGALADGGFEGKERAIAFRTLLSYVFGAIQLEHLGSLSGAGTAALAELPRAQYPLLADTAGHARRLAHDEEFRRGLGIVLRGLDTTLSKTRGSTPRT